jgi:response regulator of citrate/malate metabolism
MPWQNVTPMEEIIRFVTLAQTARFTVTELCEQFGISRKTGYKHLERYAEARRNPERTVTGGQPGGHRL